MAWFAAEAWFVAGYGLPFGPRAWVAALARERSAPVLAAQALARPHRSTGAAPTWPRAGVRQGWRRRKARMRMTNAMDDIATVMLPERVDSATSASVEALMFAALRPAAA